MIGSINKTFKNYSCEGKKMCVVGGERVIYLFIYTWEGPEHA